MDGRADKQTNGRTDGNLHAYVFLLKQVRQKPELRFMCSARRLMVFNVCVKFHENMSSGFKVMERTRKLLTDTHTHTHTHTQRKDENIIPPWHTSYAGGINSYFFCIGNISFFGMYFLRICESLQMFLCNK